MKGLKKLRIHVPRSIRAAGNILLLLLLSMLLYTALGAPSFGALHAFRRAEKANHAGPAEIIDTVSLDEYDFTFRHSFDRLLLAESEAGITMFLYSKEAPDYGQFTYRKKMGDITILAPPDPFASFDAKSEAKIPLLVFDSVPEAVRAQLTIELIGAYSDSVFQKTYFLEADRENEGYFLFILSASSEGKLGGEGVALENLLNLCLDGYNPGLAFPASVRFYDEVDNLVGVCSAVIRSPAGETYAEQESE